MKKYLYLLFIVIGLSLLISCEKEDGPQIGGDTTYLEPVLTNPTTGANVVLLKANASDTLIFNWEKADYGINIPVQYVLQADMDGNDFASPFSIANSSIDSIIITVGGLNTKFTAMGLTAETENDIEFRIMAYIPDAELPNDTLYSDVVAYTVTPYLAKDPLYMVGDFNGWNANTAPRMFQNLPSLKYELYVNIGSNGFKYIFAPGSWAGDIGDDPANPGKLIANGENNCTVATVPDYYRVEVNLGDMSWKATKFSWGIIGDATAGGWGSDTNMTYDAVNDIWTITTDLTAGALKFRANASWADGFNYGDSGADGTLESGGANISIGTAGNYTITLNLKPPVSPVGSYSYTITKN